MRGLMTGGGCPESKVLSFDRSVGRDSNLDQKGPGREPLSQLLKVTSESKPGVFHGCAHPKAKVGPNCGSNAFRDGDRNAGITPVADTNKATEVSWLRPNVMDNNGQSPLRYGKGDPDLDRSPDQKRDRVCR
jgi:hypothetical protein